MPLIEQDLYSPPLPFRYKHLNTVFPALFRKLPPMAYQRERFNLPDGDFLDLDWQRGGHRQLAILLHGLEGNSQAGYIKGLAKIFTKAGYDILAVNFRGCSGEPNRLFRSYHSGETGDLAAVVDHVVAQSTYSHMVMAGFSLGGNLLLKYLGEQGEGLAPSIKAAFAFSVPCHLFAASQTIGWLYTQVFLRSLLPKLAYKIKRFQSPINLADLKKIKTIYDFDDLYTGPVHGFGSAANYYHQCSSIHFLSRIPVPTLLINALDDPFLARECYPFEAAKKNDKLFFMAPRFGGHVGFVQFNGQGTYWAEQQVGNFLAEQIQ